MAGLFKLLGGSAPSSNKHHQASTTSSAIYPGGIKVLYNPETSVADIVFIHGLTGDREKTWAAGNPATPWPKSLLAPQIPDTRILTFGYDANVTSWEGMVSQNRIANHAWNLLTALANNREDGEANERPIIFVCHSLGGLVCADALVTAKQRSERHLQDIYSSTRGIIFLGTPHHGSGLARCAELLARAAGVIKKTNTEILEVLKRDSEVLARVQDSFHTMIKQRDKHQPMWITCFYEELPLHGVGLVVPQASAILPGYIPIGIHRNHMGMTKFDRIDDSGFIAVSGEIRRWVKELRFDHKPGIDALRLTEERAPILPGGGFTFTSMTQSETTHLTWLSGYVFQGTERYCAVWDIVQQPTTLYCIGLNLIDFQNAFNDALLRWYRPHIITSYEHLDRAARFCGVFRQTDGLASSFCRILGSQAAFESVHAGAKSRGYCCIFLNVTCIDGRVQLIGIWEQANTYQTMPMYSLSKQDLDEALYKYCTNRDTGESLSFCNHSGTCSYYEQDGILKFASVFSSREMEKHCKKGCPSKLLLTRKEVEQETRNRLEAGFVLESINPVLHEGQEKFNCTWHYRGAADSSRVRWAVGLERGAFQRLCRET